VSHPPPEIASVLGNLTAQKLLLGVRSIQELAGNADRKPERARWHYLVAQENGPALKLTIARDLTSVVERSRAFAAQVPALTPREVFFANALGWQNWAVEAVDGPRFEELNKDSTSAARMLAGMAAIESALYKSARDTSRDEFAREWNAFATSVLDVPSWTQHQRHSLAEKLLPALGERLRSLCTSRRWTNGDFTSTNLSLRANSQPALFDAEFASLSHFFPEETVRFRRLSPLCHRHPALLDGWWGRADPAWEVFFQLRQLTLEHAENNEAYVARVVPERLAAIRFFGESWLECFPADWPEPLEPEPTATLRSESVQFFWRGPRNSFSEQNSIRVEVRTGVRQLVGFRTSDAFAAWRVDPAHSQRKVRLYAVTPVHSNSTAGSTELPLTFQNAHTRRFSDHIEIEPTNADPQIHFALPPGSLGLVVDLECL
jgi:hypothetical protein